MAFLDNSGDIILDAVLTDTGRYRLAKGDGSFRITKFALSDDEINYKLYNKNNPSGSAYYDLEIMQTPIFEAFTNNTSTMQHKLLSIPRTNLLYLPVMEINDRTTNTQNITANGGFAVSVTTTTDVLFSNAIAGQSGMSSGVMGGETGAGSTYIRVDQGLDTDEISWIYTLDQDLKETQYIIEIDSRIGIISQWENTNEIANISFIDDDNIASYYLSQASDANFVSDIKTFSNDGQRWTNATTAGTGISAFAVIEGPQGTCLTFRINSTLELISSDFLFDQIGGTMTAAEAQTSWGGNGIAPASGAFKYIDTIIKITGATTGYRLDIPIRFIKA